MAGRNFLFFTALLSLVILTLARTTKQSNTPVVDNRNGAKPSKVELVVASGQGDDPAWVKDAVSDWPAQVYAVNEAEDAAMAFLTYIIDNYHQLPAVTVFHHAIRYQMRPDNRVFDSALVLQQLRTDHVMKRGFANLHCGQQIECPDSILTKHEHSWILSNINEVAAHFKRDFEALLPGEPVPEKVAVPTGSEFAVADWAIRQRSKKDWQRIRQWVMDSKHKPAMTEGIINHAWHSKLPTSHRHGLY